MSDYQIRCITAIYVKDNNAVYVMLKIVLQVSIKFWVQQTIKQNGKLS